LDNLLPPRKKENSAVPADVVEVDPSLIPIPAAIVEDKRNTLGKRLGAFAIIILLLFFAIGGYISSAQNNSLLHRAAKDRTALIDGEHKLVKSNQRLVKSNKAQSDLIRKLQQAIREQNKILREAGLETVPVPSKSPSTSSSGPSSNPSHNPQPKPKPSHSPHPHPHPTHSPPPPDAIQKVRDRVCNLTGICVNISQFFRF